MKNVFLIQCACILLGLSVLTGSAQAAQSDSGDGPSLVPGYTLNSIRALRDKIERTGLAFDSIRSIDRPQFVSVSDASLSMDDDEIVFIVEFPEGITRIYPQRILVWHEVLNDTLPAPTPQNASRYAGSSESDRRYTIVYSPLSGSVSAFRSVAGRFPSPFGGTGDLINANSVLYDRVSHSLWSHMLGICFEGPLEGRRMERIQVLWASWKGTKHRYMGKAEVLSRSTGIRRPYGRDPYGSYLEPDSYYGNTRINNRISFIDKRLHPKTRILGIECDALYAALQVDKVKEQQVINFSVGITPMVALFDAEINAVRVFDRRIGADLDERPLDFTIFEGRFTDVASRSIWSPEGLCTYGKYRDKRLTPVFTLDAMWMSWAAFHRSSPIFP